VRRYVVLVAADAAVWESASPDVRREYVDAHDAFAAYVDAHGRRLDSAALGGPETATTVRHVDGQPVVTDGPFVETVESVAGFYDVELPDLDAALEAARLLPPAYTLEVRPVVGVEGYDEP
jgi:hypothetical protein